MQIEVSTDRNIDDRDQLAVRVGEDVADALRRFGEYIGRVEVHLIAETEHAPGLSDKRCTIEARLAGRRPTRVTRRAATVDEAVAGAAAELMQQFSTTLGRPTAPGTA